jgi:uncharacterized protein YjiS (DUF1127 family)
MQRSLSIEAPPASAFGLAAAWPTYPAHLFRRVSALAHVWAVRRSTRLALAELEPHRLADVGLTGPQARNESAKAFWRR